MGLGIPSHRWVFELGRSDGEISSSRALHIDR